MAIATYLLIGFVYSAVMARWFEQDSESDILFNFLLWWLSILIGGIVMAWRLLAGYTPSYYKKRHYIWSRW